MTDPLVLDRQRRRRARFDDDPVAHLLAWEPLTYSGSSFKSSTVSVRDGVLRVRPSVGAILYCLPAVVISFLLLAGNVAGFASADDGFFSLVLLVMGLLFAWVAAYMIAKLRSITLDPSSGWYYTGARPVPGCARTEQGQLIDIHAIQVIAKRGSDWRSIEVNLACHDGTRINVLDHGDMEKIEEAIGQLAAFLDVPVWQIK